MSSNSSTPLALLNSISLHVNHILTTQERAQDAFLSILRQGHFLIGAHKTSTLVEASFHPPSTAQSPEHAQFLSEFLSINFPSVAISSERYVATNKDPVNHDLSEIIIHGRIASAYLEASRDSSTKSYAFIRFLVLVNIVHELAHALRTRYVVPTNSVLMPYDQETVPFYYEQGLRNFICFYSEAGFFAERATFGGLIGVVFENEREGERPAFFDIDFKNISHFFLLGDSGDAYRLDYSDIRAWMEGGIFNPFDIQALVKLDPKPSSPRMRLCAMLNSSHLPRTKVSGYGGDDPDEVNGETYQSDSGSDSDQSFLDPADYVPAFRRTKEPYYDPEHGWVKE